jgi:hypothetical protein
MAWYSFFLISLPEAIAIVSLLYGLFGIGIKCRTNVFLGLVFSFAVLIYTTTLYMENQNIKLVTNLVVFILLIRLLQRTRWSYSVILGIVGFVVAMIYQLGFSFLIVAIWNVDFNKALEIPWQRVALASPTILAMSFTARILYKHQIFIKLPGLSEC